MFDVFDLYVPALWCAAFVLIVLLDEPRQNYGRGLVDRKLVQAPQQFYCWPSQGSSSVFGSFVVLDVVFRYLLLFLLDINIKIGKNRCIMLD